MDMASMSEFPFVRKPRLAASQKTRPIMKLEWNKLLAEATEKDVKLNKQPVDKDENYYDDVYDVQGEGESDENINNGGGEEERPLNLCFKSHTTPNLGNKFPNPLDAMNLSSAKKMKDSTDSLKPESIKKIFSTVSNFQFNEVNSTDTAEKIIETEPLIENKENIFSNNHNNKNIFSTPSNSKPIHNGREIEEGRSCIKEMKFNSKPVFYSEKKPAPSFMSEKVKISSQEKIKNKVEIPIKKIQSTPEEPKKGILKPDSSIQQRLIGNSEAPQSQKFAVPAEPAKHKEASKSLVINKKSYKILALLGKGGSSKVYLVLNSENELLAVKCVKLSDVSESTKNDYLNEIQHLKKMQHSKHVIKLYDYQYLSSQKLFAVMERGDTDLSRFLKDKASSDEGISPELVMYYWTEMLLAVKSIHDNNIIHRDLKPANFLLVSGRLKLIDFGIASSIQTEQTSVFMESQSGTFNYMSPEALQDLGSENKMVLKIGRKTDVWSLGCILYSFLYKKTPYQDIVKPLHKMRAITDPNHKIPFPEIPGVPHILIESCKRCLIHDTKQRASIEELLAFRNRPLLSLSQVLGKLQNALSPEEYEKAAKAFEEFEQENS